MRIDSYEFVRMVIDGREEKRDLILTSSTVRPNWWRRRGHELALDAVADALSANPQLVVVGAGAAGLMRPQLGLEDALRRRGVAMEAMPTADAVRRVNELFAAGAGDWVAAFHSPAEPTGAGHYPITARGVLLAPSMGCTWRPDASRGWPGR